MERKLAAIFSTDVKGYSRLMGEDEVATIRTLTAYRDLMATLIQQHRGRVVDSPGDNLAEFPSVVEAVQCGVAIQKDLQARNAELPPHRRMEFRIGINLGDVIAEEERLYGDGVNIAARLEGLAEAGGLCISGTVYDQVKTKLDLGYEDLGAQAVKNIAEPVRVYRVHMEPRATVPAAQPPKRLAARLWRREALVVVGLLIILGGAMTVWQLAFHPPSPAGVIPSERAAALLLPDKPSIAVLPFANMSNDPEQEYFSDGMTEDLITDLSKLSGLFVIARNSVFIYKGKAVRPEQVGRELGVRYVLEGSVRKAANRVRITAQLVDATTGYQCWAERYDRELQDIFAVQEEIARKFEHAISLDPTFAAAYAALGRTYRLEWVFQWDVNPRTLERAFELAQRAIALDHTLPMAHRLLGEVYLWNKQHDQAIAAAERAIALDPNDAEGYATLSEMLSFAGRPEEALGMVQKAMRLNPHYPPIYVFALGHAYYLAGRHAEALAALKRALIRHPDFLLPHAYLVAIYSELGREDEAGAEMAEVLRLNTGVPPREHLPYKDPAVLQRLRDPWFKPKPMASGTVRSESGVLLPPSVHIEPPAADLPPEVGAFSGTWEGKWEEVLPGRLVVERIDAEWARLVLARADDPGGRFKGGWVRVAARVLPGGRLQGVLDEFKLTFTFEMSQDRMSIHGEMDAAGRVSKVLMKRVGALP